MHHSWRQDRGHSPSIKLPMPDGTKIEIKARETMRILGLHIDRKFTFNQHVCKVAQKAKSIAMGSCILANTIRGVNQMQLCTIYRACMVPVITYACTVWWTGKKVHLEKLTKIQTYALRHMAGAFRTTPTKALEVDMAIPPLEIVMDTVVGGYTNRLLRLKESNPIIGRLKDDWRQTGQAANTPPLPSRKPTKRKKNQKLNQLKRIAKMMYKPMEGEHIDPFFPPPWHNTAERFGDRLIITGVPKKAKKKEEAKQHNERVHTLRADQTQLLMYSDGSMKAMDTNKTKTVGWGFIGYYRGEEVLVDRGGLGSKAEVYDAKLMGIAKAVKAAMGYARTHRQVKHIHIFADNTAAVTLVYKPKLKPGQLHMLNITHLVDKFLNKRPNNTVGIEWWAGNVRVDREAKKGTEMWKQDYNTYTYAGRRVREAALETWTKEWWTAPQTGRFAIANNFPPRWKTREDVVYMPREIFGRLTQCRTKHAFLGEYYAKFLPNENIGCTCSERYQTREHVIQNCLEYEEQREILREANEQMELGTLLGTKDGLEAMTKFLGKTGAFTKMGHLRPILNELTAEDEDNDEEEESWWNRMERIREGEDGGGDRRGGLGRG
ncbi:RNA-directed DNA polymerase from mobile element jockey [Termitomyces sp. J132]|nr:RNA-directed DNA polymerase from mobile element jockey [Termitomyces sp. J132]